MGWAEDNDGSPDREPRRRPLQFVSVFFDMFEYIDVDDAVEQGTNPKRVERPDHNAHRRIEPRNTLGKTVGQI